MTNEEAINELLQCYSLYSPFKAAKKTNEAISMAIAALEGKDTNIPNQWIPVSERLPEDDTEVIVSCTDDSGDSEFSYTTTGWHFKGIWVVGNERNYFVRAWMSLPKSWKGKEKNDNFKCGY